MESHLDGRVLVWPEAFSPEECEILAGRFPYRGPGVALVQDPVNAYEVGLLCGARMKGGPALQWLDWVTLPQFNRSVAWHLDEPKGATHKLCVYLDPGPGTEFRGLGVVGGYGAIVLFDIGLEHRSGEGAAARRCLGLRAKRIRT